MEGWQKTIEVVEEDGRANQMRLFTDREGGVPESGDVAEVVLSSLAVCKPRQFGDCWIGCRMWEELGLGGFWGEALKEEKGNVPWEKVVELLVVNRLCAPGSELALHEKWIGQTAMEFLLGTGPEVGEKDRLYRCLDRMVEHKEELEKHLAGRWEDLFGATFDLLLYDLTSTYFEGEVEEVEKAKRGYSRDHRGDCKQVVLALVATPEGLPLSYEVFDGNRVDVTTMVEILEALERKYGKARRILVFDRGIVSEENLEAIRKRGGLYLTATTRRELDSYEKELLNGEWKDLSGEVKVQLVNEGGETYVLAKSSKRSEKEKAMRQRWIKGLMRDLAKMKKALRDKRLVDEKKIYYRLGRFQERHPQAWGYVKVEWKEGVLKWEWDKERLKFASAKDGAYLLRTNLNEKDPEVLWRAYIQLTEVEAVFRILKSDLRIRPIWHFTPKRVEAHLMVAFLGYCLWVCLKHKLKACAPSLTPWQVLDQFKRIWMVEVWFKLKDGRSLCLPRITQPEPAQAALLDQLGWKLPEQPPPRIYANQVSGVWPT